MSITTAIASVTGLVFGKKNPHRNLKVLFHEKALPYGNHGILIANNRSRGFKMERIRFVFDGVAAAPALNCQLLEHVWEEAIKQGYEPISLPCYGTKSYFKTPEQKAAAIPRVIPAVQHVPEAAPADQALAYDKMQAPGLPLQSQGIPAAAPQTVHRAAADRFDAIQSRYDPAYAA